MTTPLRVGIVGAGDIARQQHIPGWLQLPQAKLAAIADNVVAAAERAREEFHIERAETDYRRLLDDPSIDVIDICCPSGLHAEVAIAALKAGKHVLCEKPLATSRADAVAVLAAERASGKKLMVAQQFRFDCRTASLLQGIGQLNLGHVYFARGQWLRRRRVPGRPGFTRKELSGGGPLYDLGVHMLDLAWWLMGCPAPLSASGSVFNHLARRGDLRGEWGTWDPATIDVEDFAIGLLRFEGGGLLSLEVSWLGFQPEQDFHRLQLFGTRAGALWPDGRLFGETDGKPWDVQLAEIHGDKPHREAIRQFARAIVENTPVPVPSWQSASEISMLDALYRSAECGGEMRVERI
jgi:predicted dehydrogenase